MHRRHPGPAHLVVIALLIATAWILPGSIAAQEGDPATTQLAVGAFLCVDADCSDHTDLVADFTVAAIDSATGDVLDTCTTDAADPHLCALEVPADAQYDLAWDDAQIPAGYTWRGDLFHVADGPLGTATLIPLVPVQSPPVVAEPGHVTALPSTGTGASDTAVGLPAWLALALAATLALGATATRLTPAANRRAR